MTKIHRLFLATKVHKGTQREKEYPNHPNEKLLEVRYNETFSRKGFWPPEAKVDGGFWMTGKLAIIRKMSYSES